MPPKKGSLEVFVLLVLAGLSTFACKPKEEPEPPPPPTAALCGGSSGIQDYPCSQSTVEGWVNGRDGHRQRQHAWYLFAGLNQPANGTFLWRTWPTSTQAFPGQFGGAGSVGSAHLSLGPLPGAILERPAEGTPRFAGSDAAPGGAPGGAIDDQNLALPGGPIYSVPPQVLGNPAYAGCVHYPASGPPNLIDGPRFQNNGDVMVAGVVYSPDAASWILSNNLFDAAFLDSRVPPGTGTTTQATQMPPTSVVLKPMLWPVPNDRFVALPQWGFADPDADRLPGGNCEIYSGFERKDLWTEAVAVTAMVGPQLPTADATYLNSPSVQLAVSYTPACDPTYAPSTGITYASAPTADLGKFYTVRFTPAEFAALAPCDRALLDQSAYWAYGRAFGQNDVLVLVAMHMMTKEQPGWTFQSAWWYRDAATCTGSGDCSRFAGNRPTDVQGAATWKNYLMTTTYGQNQKPGQGNTWPPTLATDTTWPLAFNPYIELAATHPIETNCVNCHRRAAWPSRITKSQQYPNRSSAYLVAGQNVPGLLDEFELNDPVFNGLTTVDSMWAISDRAYYPAAGAAAAPGADDSAGAASPPAAAADAPPVPQP